MPPSPCHPPGGTSKARAQSPASCVQSPLITKMNGNNASFWGDVISPCVPTSAPIFNSLSYTTANFKCKTSVLLVSPQGSISGPLLAPAPRAGPCFAPTKQAPRGCSGEIWVLSTDGLHPSTLLNMVLALPLGRKLQDLGRLASMSLDT